MDLLSIVAGIALAGFAYFIYLAATKGVPAAYAKFKGWWNAGKAGLATIESDVAEVTTRVGSLETSLGELQQEFAKVKALLPQSGPAAS